MKVRFISPDGVAGVPTSGKGRFMERLASVFSEHDIEPVYNLKDFCDIDFYISKFHYGTNACHKRILRLGPVHVDTNKDIKTLNRKKKHAVKRVDGVIYQSAFAKKMCDTIIGPSVCPSTVIFNGAVPWNGPSATSPHKINFMASSRKWVNQKRLIDVIEAFLVAGIPDSGLFIAGNIVGQKMIKHPSVHYLGPIGDDKLFALHKLCHAMIHIVWLDVCPNGVVEALVNGCPVISGDQGGTKELGVQTVVPDYPWNFKPRNLDKTPRININLLADAIVKHSKLRTVVDASHLHIDEIARQYSAFFKRILNEGK